jgi:hypothetical protein
MKGTGLKNILTTGVAGGAIALSSLDASADLFSDIVNVAGGVLELPVKVLSGEAGVKLREDISDAEQMQWMAAGLTANPNTDQRVAAAARGLAHHYSGRENFQIVAGVKNDPPVRPGCGRPEIDPYPDLKVQLGRYDGADINGNGRLDDQDVGLVRSVERIDRGNGLYALEITLDNPRWEDGVQTLDIRLNNRRADKYIDGRIVFTQQNGGVGYLDLKSAGNLFPGRWDILTSDARFEPTEYQTTIEIVDSNDVRGEPTNALSNPCSDDSEIGGRRFSLLDYSTR